jgi:hypothetical protein
MSIQMQKSWTVSVKSKSASFAQRFIITGADSGNGTYDGKTTTPPVFVSGDNWSIRIQNKPTNQSWIDSDDQITLPKSSSGLIWFDIQSNDAGGDEDFNDLILTCSTPQSSSDFILYGHAACYSGNCLLNPCSGPYIVVDTLDAFREVIKNPLLRDAVKELYPERVAQAERFPFPFPEPDPAPFTPIMLPLQESSAVPSQLGQELRVLSSKASKKAKDKEKEASSMVAGRVVNVASQAARSVAYDRVALADLAGKLQRRCDVEDLSGFVLRFSEYDRSTAELSGGAYNDEGTTEALGMAVTDRNGNYIFRFSRSAAEFVEEALNDTPTGGDPLVQMMPDVIAELLDSTAPDGVAHKTTPYWNIPSPLKRIDICIPCSKVRRPVTECTGTYRFESVGRIRIGIPANTFDSSGRITATDSSGNVPQARCAAWENTLDLNGCLGDHNTVKYYTLRYRRYQSGTGWTSWEFYQERLKLFKTSVMDNVQIGPFDRNLEVINGSPLETVKAYNNVQGDYDWASSEWALRASVNTNKAPFGGHIGPVEFRIQGYDAAGQQVADPRIETIRLYLDNTRPDFLIDTIMLGEQEEGDTPCGVFTLAGEPVPAVMTVRFKAIQEQGFMQSYELYVRKGNLPSFPVNTTSGPLGETSSQLSNAYVHTGGSPCSALVGTRPPDEMTAVGDYATAYITPQSPDWLESGQTVCAFAIKLNCYKRVTNGYNTPVRYYGTTEKLLAIKQS